MQSAIRKTQSLTTRFRVAFAAVLALGMLSVGSVAQADRLPTTRPGPDAAVIAGSPARLTEDIFSVIFVGIDGRNMQPRDIMWLEPGRYELRVVVNAGASRMGNIRRPARDRRHSAHVIEVELEAGKRYHIRARQNRGGTDAPEPDGCVERDCYNLIVWKIEEI